jgi:acetolactate synthase-1/2/3 large subunit
MLGMHGTFAANKAVHQADLLISLGVRFSDRVTGKMKSFSPHSYKIHIDIDAAELNKNLPVLTTDVGQHQIWTAHHYAFNKPRSLLTSGGLGTMGYGFPAAIGASSAAPDQQVVCISGDGSFQMNLQELMTAVDYRLPVKVAILNNGYLGMVRQWQELFYERRYSSVQLSSPDYVKFAQSYGATGLRAHTLSEAQEIIRIAFSTPGPVIMEFDVTEEENVYPIVPPGLSNSEMIIPE